MKEREVEGAFVSGVERNLSRKDFLRAGVGLGGQALPGVWPARPVGRRRGFGHTRWQAWDKTGQLGQAKPCEPREVSLPTPTNTLSFGPGTT